MTASTTLRVVNDTLQHATTSYNTLRQATTLQHYNITTLRHASTSWFLPFGQHSENLLSLAQNNLVQYIFTVKLCFSAGHSVRFLYVLA
jgi:hypothetical protein